MHCTTAEWSVEHRPFHADWAHLPRVSSDWTVPHRPLSDRRTPLVSSLYLTHPKESSINLSGTSSSVCIALASACRMSVQSFPVSCGISEIYVVSVASFVKDPTQSKLSRLEGHVCSCVRLSVQHVLRSTYTRPFFCLWEFEHHVEVSWCGKWCRTPSTRHLHDVSTFTLKTPPQVAARRGGQLHDCSVCSGWCIGVQRYAAA